jgi:hypothetical protein
LCVLSLLPAHCARAADLDRPKTVGKAKPKGTAALGLRESKVDDKIKQRLADLSKS